jgi:RNA polymerase sigma-B factor
MTSEQASFARGPVGEMPQCQPELVAVDALVSQLDAAVDERTREDLIEQLVLANMGVARALARRYRGRGIALEDLEQVARLGLVAAARRFDPRRNRAFLAFAVPTIRGEILKHFRDLGWMVKPPRRIQELQASISVAAAKLTQELGRSPRPSELAEWLGADLEEVQEALATEGCYRPTSLDRPVGDESGSAALGDLIPIEDDAGRAAEARLLLAPLIQQLGQRDRQIVYLRFFRGWTQEEIGREIGVTQMHVSRLLSRILSELRDALHEAA